MQVLKKENVAFCAFSAATSFIARLPVIEAGQVSQLYIYLRYLVDL